MLNETIEVQVAGPVATVVVSRPDRRNALTLSMIAKLREALADLHMEKRVRGVILTGAGEAFCAGRDVEEMAAAITDDEQEQRAQQEQWGKEAEECRELVVDMLSFPKPIIVSVNGPAAGFGAALVLASDIAIATPQARLGLPETRRGLVAGLVAPLAAYRVGAGPAARLLLSGELLVAKEILRMGIYHEVVPFDLAWARAAEVAATCAAGAPQAVGLTKRLLLETVGEKLLTDLSSGAAMSATARTTDAAKEGLRAFVEKRPANWD